MRAKYGWPRKSVQFSNTEIHQPDGYRQNGPGFVSMCWDIPLDAPRSSGGMSSVTLLTEGWAYEISPDDLKPGDALGYLGPDSASDPDGGVIVIFERWLDRDLRIALTWDQLPVVGLGPDQRARPVDFRWHAYRFRDIVDDVELGQ